MNLSGLSDSIAGAVEAPPKCRHCEATTRLGNGLCLKCTLRNGLDGDREASRESFETILSEDDVKDTHWRVGNYEILEEIGRGGMGVIYRARQRHSRRIVALKRMVSYHADSRETLGRFRREAEAAASLDHPNILPIYEIGQGEDGLPFFSMKYAAGGSLLQAGRALHDEPSEAVRLMAKVARAVQFAHEHGVLHRDLKPGNILLDGRGEPFVTDFGLAKWLDANTDLTRTLTIFGTPGYIAPEQAKGPAAKLTPAADVYSLGAILFGLFTGRPPFLGEHALAVIQQASEKPAPKLRSLAPALDRDLETICARCLEREPQARYRSAGDLAVDLERWLEGRPIIARRVSPPVRLWRWSKRNQKLAAATALAFCAITAAAFLLFSRSGSPHRSNSFEAIRSIAVLPLRNLTGNPENEYLTDGITEGLIRGLSKAEGLKVISRTSAFAFKGNEIDPREVGGQLDAMTIVQGSIRQSQSGVRVSVQLVRTSDGSAIWSGESFDHTLSNALTLESELIRSVAVAIRPNLRVEQENRMARRYTENSEAYQVYLRGRYLWNKRTGADADNAIRCFEQAILLDPNFALAYSGLADVYVTQSYFTDRPFAETLPKARAAAEKALSIDSNLSDAHATLGLILAGDMESARAEKEYKLALDLDPYYPTAHSRYAFLLMHAGRLDESLREMQRAVELDPLSIETNTDLGLVLNVSSHLDEAVARYQIALEMDRNFADAHGGLGCTYRRKGDLRRSIAELETAHQLSPKRADLLGELGCSYALAGEIDKATSVIEELKAMQPRTNVSPFDFARVYAALKQNDKAVDALESAYQMRRGSIYDLSLDPIFDSVRAEPPVQRMLAAIGAPH